jgi:hypothetical protein
VAKAMLFLVFYPSAKADGKEIKLTAKKIFFKANYLN